MKWLSLNRLRHAPEGDEPAEIYGYRPYLVALSGAWVGYFSCFTLYHKETISDRLT